MNGSFGWNCETPCKSGLYGYLCSTPCECDAHLCDKQSGCKSPQIETSKSTISFYNAMYLFIYAKKFKFKLNGVFYILFLSVDTMLEIIVNKFL